ncbi:peptidoglycan editing factor PgeF [Chromatium okenii]|uniref:peptidoglycan editing factor PgeF n=1 Tax=Chromatium okenii TaxID=61644 RepID=UPI0026EF963B|nr:peptidoglycan editing factor PgeF [Chromatium okenii]MBV5307943.1 peptidoglycan editing factor PgeF [Chromatium okenii]
MELIQPDWPAPSRVRAFSTTRSGGVSSGAFASLNLADHVGDAPADVATNRARLRTELELPTEPCWLRQVHGCTIVTASSAQQNCEADGSLARESGAVCAVMTADCLPLLFCDERGTSVAAVHAGWRGLADGVIEMAVATLALPPEQMLVWLGPAIGATAFEVGDEVRERFMATDSAAGAAFMPSEINSLTPPRWQADLFLLARQRLQRLGIERIYGGGDCTFSQPDRFFSYRRDGITGRMASVIWLAPDTAAS